jgi:DNA repair protein RadC
MKKTPSVRSEDSGIYAATAAGLSEDQIIAQALEILESRFVRDGEVLSSPEAVRDYLKLKLARYPYEVFAVLLLDNRHRVISYEELFRGTIDGASVHPREVVRKVIETNAAAVIFAHNHPSGVAEPSQADLRITQRLKEALALIDVRVLDHLIVGEGLGASLAERGLL